MAGTVDLQRIDARDAAVFDFGNRVEEVVRVEEILEEDAALRLKDRIALIRSLESDDTVARFTDKLMFGSDWHVMTVKEPAADQYVEAFERVFEGDLGDLRGKFFGENALNYLDLDGFIKRAGLGLGAEELAGLQTLLVNSD